jgi:hypothetical protein
MKIRFMLIIALAAIPFLLGATTETRQLRFVPLRTAVTADDSVLDGATAGLTYNFSDKSSSAKALNSEYNVCEVIFKGTDAADEAFNYKVYAYRDDGPARLVCYGAVTLGTAVGASSGEFYGDTITATSTWITSVKVVDSGNNRIASLVFDLCGYRQIYVEIDIPASGEVASASALIAGY